MKLWSSTANELQRSRCCEIGLPEGEKMTKYGEAMFIKEDMRKESADFMNNSGKGGWEK
jgi:hypothetical protein